MFSRDVSWFSSLHREVFSGHYGFPSPQKPKFDLIVLIVNLSYSTVSLISAPALEKIKHLNKVPYLYLYVTAAMLVFPINPPRIELYSNSNVLVEKHAN